MFFFLDHNPSDEMLYRFVFDFEDLSNEFNWKMVSDLDKDEFKEWLDALQDQYDAIKFKRRHDFLFMDFTLTLNGGTGYDCERIQEFLQTQPFEFKFVEVQTSKGLSYKVKIRANMELQDCYLAQIEAYFLMLERCIYRVEKLVKKKIAA